MTHVRTLARAGTGLLAAALLFGLLPAAVHAQQPPMSVYGSGLDEGQVVEAFIDGASCGSATADAEGQWLLQIGADAACAPAAGDTITFTLDGQPTDAAETFQFGGAPADVANGVTLEAGEATPTATGTLPPAETGNAGLAGGSSSGLPGLLLALGLVVAAATVAGVARAATAARR